MALPPNRLNRPNLRIIEPWSADACQGRNHTELTYSTLQPQTPTMKDHISGKTKSIQKQFQKYFGFSWQSVVKAANGDLGELKKIGEQGRQGRIMQQVAPVVAASTIDALKGTATYNKALSDIAIEGARSGINIDRSVMNVTLANSKYVHDRSETAKEFVNRRDAENFRHQTTMEYLDVKGEIDKHISVVDAQVRIANEANRPTVKQLQATEQQEIDITKHLLTYGENARTDLLPIKNYELSEPKKKSIWSGWLRLFSQD